MLNGGQRREALVPADLQSALTGHLVLSTLHTNTAASAITRLEDMGIERYLITSAVNGVLAQRLLRTLCKHCKVPHQVERDYIQQTGLRRWVKEDSLQLYQAGGCAECNHTGYSGRTGIHELFVLDEEMHRVILSGADATLLHVAAKRQGMVTLYEDGLRKVVQGVSSMEELLRVTQDQSEAESSPSGAATVDAPAAESLSA